MPSRTSSSTSPSPSPDPLRARARLLAARLVLGEPGDPDDAVRLGVDLVTGDHDTPAVVRLASFGPRAAWVDVAPVARAAVAELGVAVEDERRAAWIVARHHAERLLGGGAEPLAAVGELWSLWERLGRPGEVAELVQVVDQWEAALAEQRPAIEEELRGLAGPVLAAADEALGPSD